MQTSGVRQANLRAILTLVATNPGLSAADLSRRSGLAPQTVALLLEDLSKAGLLQAGELLRGRRGQPATPYTIAPSGAFAIGVEIGWQHIEATLVNFAGDVIGQYRRDYAFPDARTIFNEMGSVTRQLTGKLADDQRSKIVGLGIASPGGIERNVDLLDADPELGRRWHDIDVAEEATKATGHQVHLYNDGNAACWAELIAHQTPRPTSFAYLLIGTFIGAGIIAEGALWEGPTGNSANLGSMLVADSQGTQNFAHLLASIHALQRRLAKAGIVIPATTPLFWPWDEWEPHVSEWIAEAAPALAQVISNTAAVIEFRSAVVDGVMPPAVLDRMIVSIRESLATLPTLTFDMPEVRRGHLGGTAPAIGAAYLPLYRRFYSRDLTHMRA